MFENFIIENNSDNGYKSWKLKNVTLRGISLLGEPNKNFGSFGNGLYTATLSNKNMAKQYGHVHFVVNAIPKKPKIVNNLNDAEIFRYNLVSDYCKSHGEEYSLTFFELNTSMDVEMLKLGFDGFIIKGREIVNYKPVNIIYFKDEIQLKNYYMVSILGQNE